MLGDPEYGLRRRFRELFDHALNRASLAFHKRQFQEELAALLSPLELHEYTSLIHEHVQTYALGELSLKCKANTLTIGLPPHTSFKEKVRRMMSADGFRWPIVYIETPSDVIDDLRQIAMFEPFRFPFARCRWTYDPTYSIEVPLKDDLIITLEKAAHVAPVLRRNDKFERDWLLGFLLHTWDRRSPRRPPAPLATIDDERETRPDRQHKAAWSWIASINHLYGLIYRDMGAEPPSSGLFDLPNTQRGRNEIFQFAFHHQTRRPQRNTYKAIHEQLATFERKQPYT